MSYSVRNGIIGVGLSSPQGDKGSKVDKEIATPTARNDKRGKGLLGRAYLSAMRLLRSARNDRASARNDRASRGIGLYNNEDSASSSRGCSVVIGRHKVPKQSIRRDCHAYGSQ